MSKIPVNYLHMRCISLAFNEMLLICDVSRSPSLGSNSLSGVEEGEDPRDVDRYYGANTHHQAVSSDMVGQVPEIYIPNPEYLSRFPASELRYYTPLSTSKMNQVIYFRKK